MLHTTHLMAEQSCDVTVGTYALCLQGYTVNMVLEAATGCGRVTVAANRHCQGGP